MSNYPKSVMFPFKEYGGKETPKRIGDYEWNFWPPNRIFSNQYIVSLLTILLRWEERIKSIRLLTKNQFNIRVEIVWALSVFHPYWMLCVRDNKASKKLFFGHLMPLSPMALNRDHDHQGRAFLTLDAPFCNVYPTL